MILFPEKVSNLKQKSMIKIKIPYLDNSLPDYEAVGIVFCVRIKNNSNVSVIVDINVKNPADMSNDQ